MMVVKTCKPFWVVAFAISSDTVFTLSKITPLQARLEEADSTKLTEQKPDWKNKFDYVIVVNAVVSDDDLKNRQMIKEFYQVLKPGGKIYGFFQTIYCDLEIAYLDDSKSHWLTDNIINLTDSANYYHKNRYTRQILYTPLRLNRIFQESGFQRLGFEIFFNDSDIMAKNYQ